MTARQRPAHSRLSCGSDGTRTRDLRRVRPTPMLDVTRLRQTDAVARSPPGVSIEPCTLRRLLPGPALWVDSAASILEYLAAIEAGRPRVARGGVPHGTRGGGLAMPDSDVVTIYEHRAEFGPDRYFCDTQVGNNY